MANSIEIEFDDGCAAKVEKRGNNVVLRLTENGGQPTGGVELSAEDNGALRDALLHFE